MPLDNAVDLAKAILKRLEKDPGDPAFSVSNEDAAVRVALKMLKERVTLNDLDNNSLSNLFNSGVYRLQSEDGFMNEFMDTGVEQAFDDLVYTYFVGKPGTRTEAEWMGN